MRVYTGAFDRRALALHVRATMPSSRREFLATIGGAAFGIACGRTAGSRANAPVRRLDRLGVQLYTLRDLAAKDLAGTLAQVAQIGYKEVEFAGYHGKSAREVRAMLDANGLTAPSAHIGLEIIEKNAAQVFDDARVVGHEYITVPFLMPDQRRTLDDFRRISTRLNQAGRAASEAGLKVAYHNHDFELKAIDGMMPLEVMMAGTDPTLVGFEMDVYWVTNAGSSPIDWLDRHADRISMLHLKDSGGPPDHQIREVGSGTIDFAGVLARARNVRHFFVEHDRPSDAIASIRASYQYLAALNIPTIA
jgi:sugar phosphate isomerase/epimerase